MVNYMKDIQRFRDDIPAKDHAAFLASMNGVLNQLEEELGVNIVQVPDVEPAERNRLIDRINLAWLDAAGLECSYCICEPVSLQYLADLRALAGKLSFQQGLEGLALRMAKLGWSPHITSSPERCEVCVSSACSRYYELSRTGLAELLCDVGYAELREKLDEYQNAFEAAGMAVRFVSNDEISVVLQENDPPLRRRLTKRNVNNLIAIADVLAAGK